MENEVSRTLKSESGIVENEKLLNNKQIWLPINIMDFINFSIERTATIAGFSQQSKHLPGDCIGNYHPIIINKDINISIEKNASYYEALTKWMSCFKSVPSAQDRFYNMRRCPLHSSDTPIWLDSAALETQFLEELGSRSWGGQVRIGGVCA